MAEKPEARVIVPTGATVEPLYEVVATLIDWSKLMLLLLDEFGGLPVDDPGRCSSMIDRHLLQRIAARPRIDAPNVDAADLSKECDRYRASVSVGIDLVILGLGANGHVGMNEPGSTHDSKTRVVHLDRSTSAHAAEYGVTTLPTWGITVGLEEILAADEVWLMVTGSHKRSILAKTLNDPIGPEVPATQLRHHPRLKVVADYSAAGSEPIDR